MTDQKEYSKKADDISPELLAQASWWGSRTWARLGLLGLGEQRKSRLELIRLSNKSYHDLFEIENNLSSGDPDGIAKAIISLLSLLNEFNHYFIPSYNDLIREMKEYEIVKDKKLKEKENKKSLKEKERNKEEVPYATKVPVKEDGSDSEEVIHLTEEDVEIIDTPSSVKEQEEIVPKDAYYKALLKLNKYVQEKQTSFEKTIAKIKAASTVKDEEKLTIENAWSDFIKSYIATQGIKIEYNYYLTSKRPGDKKKITIIKDAYNKLHIFNKLLRNVIYKYFNSDEDLDQDSTTVAKESAFNQISSDREALEKVAQNTFKRWFNRKLMGLSSKKINRMKIIVVNRLQDFYKVLEDFMDVLEKRDSTISDVSSAFINVSQTLSDIGKKLWPVGKHYFLNQSIRKKQKGEQHIRLSEKNLRELEEQSNAIVRKPKSANINEAIKIIAEEIAPIFNGLNVELHPGGLKYEIKPLIKRDSDEYAVGIIVRQNMYLIRQNTARDDGKPFDKKSLENWNSVEKYLDSKFEQRLNAKYSKKIGFPIALHVLV